VCWHYTYITDSNPRSTTLEESTLTFTSMWISCGKKYILYWSIWLRGIISINYDDTHFLYQINSNAQNLRTVFFSLWASTIQIQPSVLVWYKADLIIISLKINLFSPCYSWKIAELALNNNDSLNHSFITIWKQGLLSVLTLWRFCLWYSKYCILHWPPNTWWK
jgi:hypothetical protein